MHPVPNNRCTVLPQRVEKGMLAKEVEDKVRREGDSLSMERKFLSLLKRKLRKKRTIADAAAQVTIAVSNGSLLFNLFNS